MMDISSVAQDLIETDPALAAEVHRLLSEKEASAGGLTSRQKELLDFIKVYLVDHNGVSPTLTEITHHMGLASRSGAHRLLSGLEQRGKIQRLANRPRAISILAGQAA